MPAYPTIPKNRQTPRFGALRDPRFDKGNFVFQLASTAPVRKATPRVPSGGATGGGSAEIVFWRSIEGSKDADSYRAYLDQYPTGSFAGLARLRIKQLNARKVAAITLPKDSTPSPATPAVGVYPAGRKAGDVFKDCDACPEMVVIPAGRFRMGDLNDGTADNEKPAHDVRIGYSFAVGKYAVTFSQWDACVSDGGCGGYRPGDWGWGRGRLPVIYVSWDDAKRYVSWLSRKTGQSYRLLSESEWEYVARAGTRTKYSWGDSIGTVNANCDGCGSQWDNTKTSPAGSFRPNDFGLYDVHVNVWEWVEDCWHENYSGSPTDGASWTSGGNCSRRVLRGGSWNNKPRNLRAANRNRNNSDNRNNNNGFRVARTPLSRSRWMPNHDSSLPWR